MEAKTIQTNGDFIDRDAEKAFLGALLLDCNGWSPSGKLFAIYIVRSIWKYVAACSWCGFDSDCLFPA